MIKNTRNKRLNKTKQTHLKEILKYTINNEMENK